jgi:hypothetical protein
MTNRPEQCTQNIFTSNTSIVVVALAIIGNDDSFDRPWSIEWSAGSAEDLSPFPLLSLDDTDVIVANVHSVIVHQVGRPNIDRLLHAGPSWVTTKIMRKIGLSSLGRG